MGAISPISSAIGMNSSGGTRPSRALSQRSSASTAIGPHVGKRDDRLVRQRELARRQGASKTLLDRRTAVHEVVVGGVVPLDAAGALPLGQPQRDIGVTQQRLRVVGRSPMRHARRWRSGTRCRPTSRTARTRPRSNRSATAPTSGRPRQQHGELVATRTGGNVAGAKVGAQPFAHARPGPRHRRSWPRRSLMPVKPSRSSATSAHS